MKNLIMFKLLILALLAAITIVPSFAQAGSNSTSTNSSLAENTQASSITAKVGLASNILAGGVSAITISGVNFKEPAPVRDHLNDEWVEITNKGTAIQDLNGWTLSDEGNHTYKFQNFTLAPKTSAKIHTGKGENSATDLYWGRTSSVWNNDGDTATIKNGSGTEIARHKEGKLKTKSVKAKKAPKA